MQFIIILVYKVLNMFIYIICIYLLIGIIILREVDKNSPEETFDKFPRHVIIITDVVIMMIWLPLYINRLIRNTFLKLRTLTLKRRVNRIINKAELLQQQHTDTDTKRGDDFTFNPKDYNYAVNIIGFTIHGEPNGKVYKVDYKNRGLIRDNENKATKYRLYKNRIYECVAHPNFRGKGFINYKEKEIGIYMYQGNTNYVPLYFYGEDY